MHGGAGTSVRPNCIVHGEWLWSFVKTHEEEGLGIGPFFVDRLQALL